MFIPLLPREAFVLEAGVAEVDEQPDLDAGGIQVVDDLRLMFRGSGFDRFQFNDDFVLDKNVGVKIPHGLPSENHLDRMLSDDRQTSLPQRHQKSFFVHRPLS